jgi:hypothetical protein
MWTQCWSSTRICCFMVCREIVKPAREGRSYSDKLAACRLFYMKMGFGSATAMAFSPKAWFSQRQGCTSDCRLSPLLCVAGRQRHHCQCLHRSRGSSRADRVTFPMFMLFFSRRCLISGLMVELALLGLFPVWRLPIDVLWWGVLGI